MKKIIKSTPVDHGLFIDTYNYAALITFQATQYYSNYMSNGNSAYSNPYVRQDVQYNRKQMKK